MLAVGLRNLGHEAFLIGAADSPLVEKARAAGLPTGAIPMAGDWDVRAARRIRARMRAWNVDLVHAHDARSHALAMIALLGRTELPLIVTRRVAFTPRSIKLKYGPRVTRFIAISRAVKDSMVSAGIDASRIVVIHSGIAPKKEITPRDWRAELGWHDDAVICGMAGAMTLEKGSALLPEIARALSLDDRRILKIVLLGGEKAGLSEIEGLTVYAAGFVDDIDPAMAGLDILLHPSSTEGLGTALIDAMALGVPPIAFEVGGIPEAVENGVSGILVRSGDTAALAEQLARLARDPVRRESLAKNARLRAQQFDAGRMTRETEAVYKQVLSG